MGFNPLKTLGTYAQLATAPGLVFGGGGKKIGDWLGGTNKGAQATNDAIGQRYSYLTGQTAPGQVAKLGAPKPETSPLKGMIGDFTSAYNDAKGRSSALHSQLSGVFNNFLGQHGGLDPNRVAALEGDIAGFRNIGRYGAADQASADRIRGGGVYDEFSKTGGYSDADKANIRGRIASITPSFFAGLKRNLDTQNRVQGGFNPGYTSQNAKMARDAGRESVNAVREGEIGLQEAINSGRKWGTEGMTASEAAIVKNMLAGLEGASSNESALMQAIRQGQMFGAQGLEGLRTSPGAEVAYGNQLLQALGMEGDQINQLLGLMSGRNPNLSNFDKYGDKIMSGAAAILGI